jgi:gluconate kinase
VTVRSSPHSSQAAGSPNTTPRAPTGNIHATRVRRADTIDNVTLVVISGVSAAGKSTVARLLARRFERGVCVPGDAIHAMVVSGRLDMRPTAGEGPLRQLVLRYAGALAVASVYLRDGFDVVVEDVIIGPVLRDFLDLVPVPEFHLVFLDPDAQAIEQRERGRNGTAYGPAAFSVGALQALLRRETDRLGLWLDTSGQSAEQTVATILADLDASRVRLPWPADSRTAEPGEQTAAT